MYATLNKGENEWLTHMSPWGSDGYPIRKLGRGWTYERFYGVGGAPIVFKTKREATAACELFYEILRDKAAGRMEPSWDAIGQAA
jgi:hypothetical protein